jgi:predicted transcriptional regulator
MSIDRLLKPTRLEIAKYRSHHGCIWNKLMARTAQDITDAELSIVLLLWERGRTTVRQLKEKIYPNGNSAHYATVQKLLERLERKKFVTRYRKPWPHLYEAKIDREELIGRRLQATADRLCDGSLAPLLSHLVGAKCSPDQVVKLRELIEEVEMNKSR